MVSAFSNLGLRHRGSARLLQYQGFILSDAADNNAIVKNADKLAAVSQPIPRTEALLLSILFNHRDAAWPTEQPGQSRAQ